MTTAQKHTLVNDSHETRISLLEQSIVHISQTLIRLENKMDDQFSRIEKKMDDKFSKIDDQFSKVDDKFSKLESKIDDKFSKIENRIDKLDNRLWQIMFLLSSSIIGLIISKIFHWI